jgi:hypothetical protein
MKMGGGAYLMISPFLQDQQESTVMVIGKGKNPGTPHLLKPAVVTSIDKQKALLIIEQVTESVSRWKIFAKTAKSCDDI